MKILQFFSDLLPSEALKICRSNSHHRPHTLVATRLSTPTLIDFLMIEANYANKVLSDQNYYVLVIILFSSKHYPRIKHTHTMWEEITSIILKMGNMCFKLISSHLQCLELYTVDSICTQCTEGGNLLHGLEGSFNSFYPGPRHPLCRLTHEQQTFTVSHT